MKYLGRVLAFAAALVAMGQSAPAPDQAKLQPFVSLVQQQFGTTFTLAEKSPTPVMTADLDGDGIEDLVVVAQSKDPLPDSYQFKYEVQDPYNSFFGFGNIRETAGMGRLDPRQNHALLVIFGSGPQAWRASAPKAKFVLLNVPFDSIEVGRMLVKKKKPPINVIKAVEAQVMESSVFWDAKKKRWRWEPGNTLD
jgi:hypothetical protein